MTSKLTKEKEEEEEATEDIKQSLFEIHKEIEAYDDDGSNATFLIDKLNELEALKQHPGFKDIFNSSIRKTGRLIRLKLLKNAVKNADIIVAEAEAEAEAGQESPIDTLFQPEPNTPLMEKCKTIIDGEIANSLDPDADPNPEQVYQDYLFSFKNSRIFTLKSYENEDINPACSSSTSHTFIQDGIYDVGNYVNAKNGPDVIFHRKYYDLNDYDTQNLLIAINYRNTIQRIYPDSKINKLISSYTYDPDADDLQSQAQDNLFSVLTVYGIVKRMTVFFATGVIDPNMRFLEAFKIWVDDADDMADPRITHLLLKRIGVMTELLWHVLRMWPIELLSIAEAEAENFKCPYNVKLYAGIGTSSKDANYQVFIAGLFSEASLHLHAPQNPQNTQPQPEPEQNKAIISRDFVSTAYSFDAAARFCKAGNCPSNQYCMLEFILKSGQALPFIGSSANEAEVLLKPGNIYRFIKRYKVRYVRESFTGPQEMLIDMYQFLLTNDTNSELHVVPLPDPDPDPDPYAVSDAMSVSVPFNYSNHADWSARVNHFINEFSALAGIPSEHTSTQDVSSQSFGGFKKGRQRKTKGRRTNRRKTKRRKGRTNRRRQMKTKKKRSYRRKTNKRRI
jgi:hypothetical protein